MRCCRAACRCRSGCPCSRPPTEQSQGRAPGWLGQRSERRARVPAEILYSYHSSLRLTLRPAPDLRVLLPPARPPGHLSASGRCGQVPRINLGVTLADMLTTAAIFGGLSVLGRLCLEECHTPFTASLRMSLHWRKSSAARSQYQLLSIWKRICFTQDIAVSVVHHNNL
jgi:hypothetical protein